VSGTTDYEVSPLLYYIKCENEKVMQKYEYIGSPDLQKVIYEVDILRRA
jgi:hypothetical protein